MQQNGSSFVKYSAFSTEMEIKSQFFVKISDCLALAPCKQSKHSPSKTKYVPRPVWGCGCKQALSGPVPKRLGETRVLRGGRQRKEGLGFLLCPGWCSGLDPGTLSLALPLSLLPGIRGAGRWVEAGEPCNLGQHSRASGSSSEAKLMGQS